MLPAAHQPTGVAALPARQLGPPADDRAAFLQPRAGIGKGGSDHDFMRDMQQAMVNERQGASALLLLFLTALLVGALTWAHFSRVEEITRGDARVIPSSREQVIQSLEGGILQDMLVREGEIVAAGQPLLRIDETRARSSYQEGLSKVMALLATTARLRAEARGTPLVFPKEVLGDRELIKNETDTYNARKQALDQAITASRTSRELIAREIAITEPMVVKGLVAEVELLRLRRQLNEINAQNQDRVSKYRVDAANDLVRAESELAQTQESLTARQDQMRRTTIEAPVRGTVKNIRLNTRGGVIGPGQDILEIIPLEDQLLVEAKIRPHDVAFLRPGLPATVKISAYDYAIYGGLSGRVELISPDTLRDERKADDDSHYRVLIRTENSTLRSADRELPIIPGMTASVEIRTGEKSILDFILKPVLKVREAFRER
jgi:adhesin transport system membrane fusion protein